MRKYFEFWEEDGRIGEWREYYGAELVGEFIEVTGIEKSAEGEWYISNMAAEGTEADLEDEDAFQMWLFDHDTYGWSCGGYETLEQAIAANNLEGDEMVQFIAKRINEPHAEDEPKHEPRLKRDYVPETKTYNAIKGYKVDLVLEAYRLEAWLYHPAYGVKMHMFGSATATEDNFLNLVDANLEEYISVYEEEMLTEMPEF